MKSDIITNIPDYSGIGIYSLTNNETGKIYVGSSINVNARTMQHLYSFRTLKCSQNFIVDLKKGHTFSAKILERFPYGISDYSLHESLKRIPLDVQKEKYEEIAAAAPSKGESVNGYIKKAIDERMERDA